MAKLARIICNARRCKASSDVNKYTGQNQASENASRIASTLKKRTTAVPAKAVWREDAKTALSL